MAITWPGTLPSEPLRRTAGGSYETGAIRTSMSVGPAKVRRRTTAAVRPFTYTFLMTATQLAAFDTFYHTTTKHGSLDFEFTNPITAATEDMRFVSAPSWSKAGPDIYEVSVEWEQLP